MDSASSRFGGFVSNRCGLAEPALQALIPARSQGFLLGYHRGRAVLKDMNYSIETHGEWPLPGRIDPHLTPCALCRRRLLVNGQPVFTTCSCQALGPSVTIGVVATGTMVLVAMGLWWCSRR